MAAMKILFLTHRVPYPPDKGDRIRSYNILKFLARHHSISLMSVSHEPVAPRSYEALKQYCDSVEIVGIDAKLSRLWSGLHLFTNEPVDPAGLLQPAIPPGGARQAAKHGIRSDLHLFVVDGAVCVRR